jgi:hypothetical protein
MPVTAIAFFGWGSTVQATWSPLESARDVAIFVVWVATVGLLFLGTLVNNRSRRPVALMVGAEAASILILCRRVASRAEAALLDSCGYGQGGGNQPFCGESTLPWVHRNWLIVAGLLSLCLGASLAWGTILRRRATAVRICG